ncbi:hypothetical protein ACHAXN_001533 [Cyclotella atomus]
MLLLLRPITFGFRPLHRHLPRLRSITAPFSTSSVEVSPSTHNTVPLIDFQSTDSFDRKLVHTLQSAMSITKPTPVQSHAIPLLLNQYDVMASSATGSGKTIMFGLPLLQKVINAGRRRGGNGGGVGGVGMPSSLLATQISEILKTFTSSTHWHIKVSLATGGSDTRQQRQSLSNCNILVGTPGRIVQFIDEPKLSLNNIVYLVIDEADRLLDLGFEKELTRISRALKNEKQSVLCSATFPDGVQRLAADFLDPKYYFVSVGVVGSTHSKIRQRFEWMELPHRTVNYERNAENPRVDAVIRNVEQFWDKADRKKDQSSVIVFSNTKDGVEEYGKALSQKFGGKKIRVIHGDKEQSERNRGIDDFKAGRVSLLVATDVAGKLSEYISDIKSVLVFNLYLLQMLSRNTARGLDVTSIGLVVQADAPRNVDTYTHRVGRTGRAGASGEAVTLIDAKSLGIASGLVDLIAGAGQNEFIPAWLQGMAHVSNARSLEDDMQIQAGSSMKSSNSPEEVINEEFTEQDFQRTAAEGSFGVGKDTACHSFDEEAYSDSDMDELEELGDTTADEEFDSDLEPQLDNESFSQIHIDAAFYRQEPSKQLVKMASEDISDTPSKGILNSLKSNQGLGLSTSVSFLSVISRIC